jgi:hypothetical protein
MSTEHIVSLLISERDKLDRAIEALGAPVKRRGRPVKAVVPVGARPRKRTLSIEGRRAIVAATKKRWALIKAGKAAEATAIAAPAAVARKRKPMTAAQKKALSVKMKAAWAKRKKAS